MKIVKRELADNIYLLRFASQYELTATFLRFQEYYESPKFAGKVFDLEQYADWYAKKYGAFTYYTDWLGFNVPGWVIDKFYEHDFDPLSRKEKQLLSILEHPDTLVRPTGNYYVIGVYEDSAIKHEFAHALYYMDSVYKKRIKRILKQFDNSAIHDSLIKCGYVKKVLDDETQAYLIEGDSDYSAPRNMVKQLREVFAEHSVGIKL